jgi:hypothetical protein
MKKSYSPREVEDLLQKHSQGLDLITSATPDRKEIEALLKSLASYDLDEVKELTQKLKEKLAMIKRLSPLALILIEIGDEYKHRINRESNHYTMSERYGFYAEHTGLTIDDDRRDHKAYIPMKIVGGVGVRATLSEDDPLVRLASGILVAESDATAARLPYKPLPEDLKDIIVMTG